MMSSSTRACRRKCCFAVILILTVGTAMIAMAWQQQQPKIHPNRRQAIQESILKAVGGGLVVATWHPNAAMAASGDNNNNNEFVAFDVNPFKFEIPKSWNVIVKPNPKKPPKDGKIFSALDFGTGAVLTVVQEQVCSKTDYALMEKQCDLVAGGTTIFNKETFSKDVTKLLRRHDDRDNVALQGTTALDRVDMDNDDEAKKFNVFATTSIPTGGTYKDQIGLDQPYMISRLVQGQVRLVDNDRIFSLWLSAPSDEWRKPVDGTRLLQVWASVE